MADVKQLLDAGKITEDQIDGMVRSILRTYFAMDLANRKVNPVYYDTFDEHVKIALQAAREGIVLLKNEGGILPLSKESAKTILATGDYMTKIAFGGGAETNAG